MDEIVEVNNEGESDSWKSCCLIVDKRAVQYFSTLSIITGIIIFCIFQLIEVQDCPTQSTYVALLTMLIGIIAPSPKFHD